MKQRVSIAAKWTGKLLLQLLAFVIFSYVVRYMISGSFDLLIRAGATLPPKLLIQHFLILSFVGGLLAGVVGLVLFRAMFLLPTYPTIATTTGWKNPKAWTWLIPTIALVVGIAGWMGSQSSVLTSSGVSFSSFFATFFGNACDLQYGPQGACLSQIGYTYAWVGTIGYSASAFLPQAHRRTELEDPQERNSELPLTSGERLH